MTVNSHSLKTLRKQSTLDKLLKITPSDKPFAQVLAEHGYSTKIKHVNLTLDATQKIDFTGCQFTDVKFTGKFNESHFSSASFRNSDFYKAELNHVRFWDAKFSHCNFVNTKIQYSSFAAVEMKGSKIWESSMQDTSIYSSSFKNTLFGKSIFTDVDSTHSTTDGVHTVFNQNYSTSTSWHYGEYSTWTTSQPFFMNATDHPILPTVIMVGDYEWHSGPHDMVSKYQGVPVTLSQHAPNAIDQIALTREVETVFADIQQHGLRDGSIAQQVIHSDTPTIKAIKEYAYKMVAGADAVWIPGGPDLHPEFYGETNTQSHPNDSYYREVMEFSLVDAAIQQNKALMGVCHGSQLVNVYFGGTLHQHVDGQSGISPELTIHTKSGLVGSVIGDEPARAPSYHHQAVKDVAKNLEVVATYNGVVKATQATDGKKVMLFQFHPEHEADKTSKNFLTKFMNLSAEPKLMAKVISLSDTIDFGDPLDQVLGKLDNPIRGASPAPMAADHHLHLVHSPMPELMHEQALMA